MELIRLRRARVEDAGAFAEIMGDEEVFGQLMQLPYPDPASWKRRLEQTPEPGSAELQLVAELEGAVVGSAGLHPVGGPWRRRHAMMLGISVRRDVQRRGVGSTLMRALLDYADRWAGVLRVELTVWADNEPAIALYRRFGFDIEGRLRGYGLRAGRYVDALAMARLNPDPPAWVADA